MKPTTLRLAAGPTSSRINVVVGDPPTTTPFLVRHQQQDDQYDRYPEDKQDRLHALLHSQGPSQ
jgi:hypothetical protein